MYGFYNPKGGRLTIRGRCDGERRVQGGVIRVTRPDARGMKLEWRANGVGGRDDELDLNVARRMVDFGGIRTDGAFRLQLAGWRITPLPGSDEFKAEIDLAHFGMAGRAVKGIRTVEPELGALPPRWSQQGDRLALSLDARAFAYCIEW